MLSACALNLGYLIEHSVAAQLPPLSIRHALRSARMLVTNRRWLAGFLTEAGGWLLYVVALALAPLSLVQAVSAGGIGILALLVSRLTGVKLSTRERLGVLTAIAGLALLGVSIAGGHGEGTGASWHDLVLWLGGSAGAVLVALGPLVRLLGGGAAFGLGTGILFAAGDVATKAAVEGGARLDLVPVVIVSYGLGTAVLQRGFQHGGALVTAGIATLFTNALPIAAGMSIFDEPLPDGWFGAVRILSFAGVVLGAVALAAPERLRDR